MEEFEELFAIFKGRWQLNAKQYEDKEQEKKEIYPF